MEHDARDELDTLIDGALPGYSSAEPLEGLEDRVLRRVQAAPAVRNPWPYRLGFAVPALAALLIAGMALWKGWQPRPVATNATQEAPAPQPGLAPATPAVKLQPVIRAKRQAVSPARSLPKEDYFPARAPMTDEERALVAWVSRAPAEAGQAFADLQKRSAEPIRIEPIQIPPLQIDGGQ